MANCCDKITLHLRLRTISGHPHYVYQCTNCGWQNGSAISKKKALEILSGREPELFDEDPYKSNHDANFQKIETASPAKTDRSFLVSRFKGEDQIKKWIEEHLSSDFEIQKEVKGKHILTGEKISIDYIFYPKYHLIVAGFEQDYFGVEVKFFPGLKVHSKMGKGVWQAMTYQGAVFDMEMYETPSQVMFTTIISNLSFGGALIGENSREIGIAWHAMLQVANHAKVGNFQINYRETEYRGWTIKFAGANYFRLFETESGPEGKKGAYADQIITKLRVGNFNTKRT